MPATAFLTRSGASPDRSRWIGLSAAIALHAAAVAVLLAYAPAREVLREVAPLMVELIASPPTSPAPPPEAVPRVDSLPKPLPVRTAQPRPEPETPVLATTAPAATAPAVGVPVDPKSLPPVEARPAPAAAPVPVPAPAVVPPVFHADYLDNPAPAYPALSRRLGEQGRVMLRVQVEADGLPTSVEVRTSSGFERLDQAALEAVRRWKFVPAKLGDKAVSASVVVPIAFNLKN